MLSYLSRGIALPLCNIVSVNYNPRYVAGMAASVYCQFGRNVYRPLSPHIAVEWSAFSIRVSEFSLSVPCLDDGSSDCGDVLVFISSARQNLNVAVLYPAELGFESRELYLRLLVDFLGSARKILM
jgi:hypothetical protein